MNNNLDTQSQNYQLASVWSRLGALLVDLLVMFFIIIVGGEFMMQLGIKSEALAVYPILFLYWYLIAKKYPCQTLGKKFFHIATVDSRTLKQPKLWQVVVRNLFRWFYVVDAVFMFGHKRQRLGDLVAKTIVVKKLD